jgi:hypothetical protein
VKTNTELRNAKSDLTKTRIDFTNKLEGILNYLRIDEKLFYKCCDWTGTKKELGKTKIDLEKTKANVNDISIKLNGIWLFYWKLNFNFFNCFTHVIMLLLMFLIEWNGSATSNDLKTTKTSLALNKLVNWKNLNLTARTSEIVDIGQMPTSCADLQRTGHKLSGFYSIKGAKKMEMIYCNFNANQNGTKCFNFIWYCSSKSFLFTDTEMDRIRRRQICARSFLRHEKF